MVTAVKGFILKETPYKESSKIIHVLTEEYGLIGISCKGVKSLKSSLRVGCEKYTYATFHINYHENRLATLIAVDILNPLNKIKSDLTLLSYLAYLSDLSYQVVKHSEENIYDLLIPTILKLEEGLNPKVLTNILEIKYLNYLGIGLNLDCCIKCGSNKGIVTLDPDAGGYICSNCYQGELIMSAKAM